MSTKIVESHGLFCLHVKSCDFAELSVIIGMQITFFSNGLLYGFSVTYIKNENIHFVYILVVVHQAIACLGALTSLNITEANTTVGSRYLKLQGTL